MLRAEVAKPTLITRALLLTATVGWLVAWVAERNVGFLGWSSGATKLYRTGRGFAILGKRSVRCPPNEGARKRDRILLIGIVGIDRRTSVSARFSRHVQVLGFVSSVRARSSTQCNDMQLLQRICRVLHCSKGFVIKSRPLNLQEFLRS